MPELRKRAGRLIAGEEEARRRLARELHDDHCQRLAALALEIKVVRRDSARTIHGGSVSRPSARAWPRWARISAA